MRQHEELGQRPEGEAPALKRGAGCQHGTHMGVSSFPSLRPGDFRPVQPPKYNPSKPVAWRQRCLTNVGLRNFGHLFSPSTAIVPVADRSIRESLIDFYGKPQVAENQRARQLLQDASAAPFEGCPLPSRSVLRAWRVVVDWNSLSSGAEVALTAQGLEMAKKFDDEDPNLSLICVSKLKNAPAHAGERRGERQKVKVILRNLLEDYAVEERSQLNAVSSRRKGLCRWWRRQCNQTAMLSWSPVDTAAAVAGVEVQGEVAGYHAVGRASQQQQQKHRPGILRVVGQQFYPPPVSKAAAGSAVAPTAGAAAPASAGPYLKRRGRAPVLDPSRATGISPTRLHPRRRCMCGVHRFERCERDRDDARKRATPRCFEHPRGCCGPNGYIKHQFSHNPLANPRPRHPRANVLFNGCAGGAGGLGNDIPAPRGRWVAVDMICCSWGIEEVAASASAMALAVIVSHTCPAAAVASDLHMMVAAHNCTAAEGGGEGRGDGIGVVTCSTPAACVTAAVAAAATAAATEMAAPINAGITAVSVTDVSPTPSVMAATAAATSLAAQPKAGVNSAVDSARQVTSGNREQRKTAHNTMPADTDGTAARTPLTAAVCLQVSAVVMSLHPPFVSSSCWPNRNSSFSPTSRRRGRSARNIPGSTSTSATPKPPCASSATHLGIDTFAGV